MESKFSILLREKIQTKMNELGYSTFKSISEEYSKLIGVKPNTASQKLCSWFSGYNGQNPDRVFENGNSVDRKNIAIFYEMLDIDRDDEIINLTRALYPSFSCFQKSQNLEENCTSTFEFQNPNYFLTKKQKKNLETIALTYAFENLSQK